MPGQHANARLTPTYFLNFVCEPAYSRNKTMRDKR
jgi:hypothetical protein